MGKVVGGKKMDEKMMMMLGAMAAFRVSRNTGSYFIIFIPFFFFFSVQFL